MSLSYELLAGGKDMLGLNPNINRQTGNINYFGFSPTSQTVSTRHEPFGHYYTPTPTFYQTYGDYNIPNNPVSFNPDKEPRWSIENYDIENQFTDCELINYSKMINPYAQRQIEMGSRYKNKLSGFGLSTP